MAKRNPGTSFASWLQARFTRFASGISHLIGRPSSISELIQDAYEVKPGRLLTTAVNFITRGRAAANLIATGLGRPARDDIPIDPNVPPASAYRVWTVVTWEDDGEIRGMTIPTDFNHIPTYQEVRDRAIVLANQKGMADPKYGLKEELTEHNSTVDFTIATRRTR